MLPPQITFLSGPGCPVCVTPTSYIDKLVRYALTPGCQVMAFGDLLAVPGSRMSLSGADVTGAGAWISSTIRKRCSPRRRPIAGTTFILAAVGFETTAPVWADLIRRVYEEHIPNVRFLTALKTMPGAMSLISGESHIDGFLCPGHVAVITGCRPFRKLAEETEETMVIGGFSPADLLRALTRLVLAASQKKRGLWNEYPSVVTEEGNPKALALLADVFTPGDAVWRGLGTIAGSGLYLREKYRALDAGSRGLVRRPDARRLSLRRCPDRPHHERRMSLLRPCLHA